MKYGETDINKVDWISDKMKIGRIETLKEKYGDGIINISQLDWVQERIKINNLKKYGVISLMQLESFRVNFLKKINSKHYKIKEFNLKNGNIINYQSGLELKFIKICENKNIEIKNGDVIEYFLEEKKKMYFIDFKIKIDGIYQLIEIKGRHKWFYKSIEDGMMEMKILAAQVYSAVNNYKPFRMIMDLQIKKGEILEPTLFENMPIINSALLEL